MGEGAGVLLLEELEHAKVGTQYWLISILLDSSICILCECCVQSWALKLGARLGCRNVELKFTLNFLEGASRVMLTIQLNLILKVNFRLSLLFYHRTKENAQ